MNGPIILALTPGDRLQLATTIERLINMLDEIDGDCELEPSLAGFSSVADATDDREGDDADDEHSLGWGYGTQERLHASDEREEENEHGGDIQDVPHDHLDEGNDEPFLGRLETLHQGSGTYCYGSEDLFTHYLAFDGSGYIEARNALRKTLGKPVLKIPEQPYAERAVRLSDGAVFRTFVVPEGFIPNRIQNQRDADRCFEIASGVVRVGF